ncbi:hypothetical protein BKA65DRAFT_441412 [Rhexocercosporidium sp. MPI-PUGE-AT-0058]|nr:hypothetical protein BKA65DRAFT_441412 [Rhexocercosporidium sp. MPI-PUGE-AT-0058]
MADISKFTSKFRLNGPVPPSPGKVSKRLRLVCNQCKKAKLRCDRAQPCGTCVKKEEADSCTYQQQTSTTTGRNSLAEDKLQHLESLVTQLIQSQSSAVPSSDVISNVVDVSSDSRHGGYVSGETLGEGPESYVGSTHWSAILEDIHGLKAALAESANKEDDFILPPEAPLPTDELIFGVSAGYSLQQIISQYLPPKIEVDRCLSAYFQGETYIVPFIHTYQFQRQYQEFWADMAKANPLWLSMLFSICHMISLIGRDTGSPYYPRRDSSSGNSGFHAAAGQCLVLGKYYRPQKFSVQALALYAHCKNLQTLDPSREVGSILSMVVRLSFEMGYHRDPESVGNFTTFEGEMRRRFWASLKQMDLMTSFQLGLPSNINLEHCDTRSPKHLLDSDFNEDTANLPIPRSENAATKFLWFVVKERQVVSFSKVCQDALSFTEKSESEISQLDTEIREMYASIPSVLRTRPISESIADQSFLIMTRIYIDFIHLKSLCILHRKYMARGNPFSTMTCVEAGSKLVTQFIEMNNEFSPGGQLYGKRWMLTNFTVNDFLLGNIVLCLAVHTCWRVGKQNSPIEPQKQKIVLALLEKSHAVCLQISPVSKDARRVSHIIRFTLNRTRPELSTGTANPYIQHLPAVSDPVPGFNSADGYSGLEGSTFSMLPPWQSSMPGNEAGFGLFDHVNFMPDEFENVDWMALNQSLGT